MGVDIDPMAIQVAGRNAARAKVDVDWLHADVAAVQGPFDTVLTNPPFGAQTKHADLPFLDKALSVARVVYSFHNRMTQDFVTRRIQMRGARVTDALPYRFPIARAFRFHREPKRWIPVVLLRVETREG